MIGRYTTRAVSQGIMGMYITIATEDLSSRAIQTFSGLSLATALRAGKYLRGHVGTMPLGDPHGGEFEYTVEGLPATVFAFTVPVADMRRALAFYTGVLGMEVLSEGPEVSCLRRAGCRIMLRTGEPGVDTGVYLGVDSPYNTHRRLVDEGVRFASDPTRGPFGTSVSLYDSEGNVLHFIETGAEFRPRTTS